MSSITQKNKTCSVEGCGRKVHAHGWCRMHHKRWLKHGDLLYEYKRLKVEKKICIIEGCDKIAEGRGWCASHYGRWYAYGDPLAGKYYLAECSVEGCHKKHHSHGYCIMHLKRLQRHGDPLYERYPHSAIIKQYHSEYHIWTGMRKRCDNRLDVAYVNYGGRGITICLRWREAFVHFLEDVGARPSKEYSIDRIDVNGNYSCGHCEECTVNGWTANCKWSTVSEQQNNKRTNNYITINGETKTITQWAEISGLKYSTIFARIRREWPTDTLLLPKQKPGPKTY